MIQDDGTVLLATVPAPNFFLGSSFGIDLNPDFGQGVDPRKSPYPGWGEDWLMRIDVEQTFETVTTAFAAFHLVLSDVPNATTEVHLGTNVAIIGTAASQLSFNIEGTDLIISYASIKAADLVAGNKFFIRPNPWTAPMGRNPAGTVIQQKNLRFLGVMIAVPNYGGAGSVTSPFFTHTFTQGTISARIVKSSDVMQNPQDAQYPTGTLMKG